MLSLYNLKLNTCKQNHSRYTVVRRYPQYQYSPDVSNLTIHTHIIAFRRLTVYRSGSTCNSIRVIIPISWDIKFQNTVKVFIEDNVLLATNEFSNSLTTDCKSSGFNRFRWILISDLKNWMFISVYVTGRYNIGAVLWHVSWLWALDQQPKRLILNFGQWFGYKWLPL